MSNSFSAYYDNAVLALAAYSDFSQVALLPDGTLNSSAVKDELPPKFRLPRDGV
jgi:hypothetical protein